MSRAFRVFTCAATLTGLLLVGCSHVRLEPTALPFPSRPELVFFEQQGNVCLTPPDADKLDKWVDELAAFENAWKRLRPR